MEYSDMSMHGGDEMPVTWTEGFDESHAPARPASDDAAGWTPFALPWRNDLAWEM